ncbi:toll/interleukin-1 receptor domain-containing protein [Sulfurospirillum oryzae]|uniref:toll/interleukin-1 receptor domain-containing protein n=1 Tax=Sulfurospirillum oryzae TaxID=2976535 RepID=UPI0021E9529B|nr:toll/interleukin-1 receptor domain-containing protein [Sulfurospirillum oryzae]
MTTIREYFDTDAKALNAVSEWAIGSNNGSNLINVVGKISYRIEEYIKYWSFYFPKNSTTDYIKYMLSLKEVTKCHLEKEPSQTIGYTDSPERYKLEDFHFTKRIYIYIDEVITKEQIIEIVDHGKIFGFSVIIRDKSYAKEKSELMKPLAFISHDSRDKDTLVRELAQEMYSLACPIWYDEYTLKGGDNLRESIEKGLKEAKKCIVILSKNFIENNGWTKTEFETILVREIYKNENILIPIWHGVSKDDIYEYSPQLLNRLGLNTNKGIKVLAKELVDLINL